MTGLGFNIAAIGEKAGCTAVSTWCGVARLLILDGLTNTTSGMAGRPACFPSKPNDGEVIRFPVRHGCRAARPA